MQKNSMVQIHANPNFAMDHAVSSYCGAPERFRPGKARYVIRKRPLPLEQFSRRISSGLRGAWKKYLLQFAHGQNLLGYAINQRRAASSCSLPNALISGCTKTFTMTAIQCCQSWPAIRAIRLTLLLWSLTNKMCFSSASAFSVVSQVFFGLRGNLERTAETSHRTKTTAHIKSWIPPDASAT